VYRGRFAPSPTGPLHFGSLIAAVASYLDAKSNNGIWLLRIEDLDTSRNVHGAKEAILASLEAFGFAWDEEVIFQSQRSAIYAEALANLSRLGLIYPCGCSRKEIADSATLGIDGVVYPGTCRHGLAHNKTARSWRIKTSGQYIMFEDAVQGEIQQNLAQDIGDFVLKRADGLFAYQLAVVVDDAEQGITHIVRGADLLDSTPRQIYLQNLLVLATPHYLHVPLATNMQGEKLSKQTLAQAIDVEKPSAELWKALAFLGQHPPAELRHENLTDFWQWAIAHWKTDLIPKRRAISISE
jgi:glutamyl-Q tRNA(Asp) synthetase